MIRQYQNVRDDRGFTILEVIMVIVLIGILAGIFAETIISTMSIYADQTSRKDVHEDVRRSFDFLAHSLRERTDFEGSPTGTLLDFYRYHRFQEDNGNIYYDPLREAFSVYQTGLTYQRDDGEWANRYTLISSGIPASPAMFTTSVLGGKTRVAVNLNMTYNGKPFRMAVTVFPRPQGAE